MTNRLRLVLALHQHQPVGNLDPVCEAIYRDCYLPLVDVLADYPALPVNLHTSGSLLDWLTARHPEYLERLDPLVAARRVEILGGAYHDPILPLLSRDDRRGQIQSFGRRLGQLFGQTPRGLWLPERIWEPALVADLAESGIEHTVLDDFHFHAAGLTEGALRGYYLTEAEGRLVAIFAGDERLRYLIPFAEPEETLRYLRDIAARHPDGVVVYADDAEKFGAWPGMRKRVHDERWLRRFFDALAANTDWLQVTTLQECVDHVAPLGKVYVPEGSYREMGPWSALGEMGQGGPNGATLARGVTGSQTPGAQHSAGSRAGTWRNFRVKYPAVDEMYCRMLQVSRRLAEATAQADETSPTVEQARQALYRAQCGCAYWHGVFGGVYLPHLRQAVYRNLIVAETLLDEEAGRSSGRLTAAIDDFNLDVHKEIQLTSEALTLFLAPDRGGQLYELDVRKLGTNLLATFARQPEPYHAGLDSAAQARLSCDPSPRKSLLDHFFDPHTTLDAVAAGGARQRGDFVTGRYRGRLRRVPGGICVDLSRRGTAHGELITIAKQLTLWGDRPVIDIRYELSGLPPARPWLFAVEFNFAGLPPGCADRYFVDGQGRILADLGQRLDLAGGESLRLVDRWLGLDVGLATNQFGGFWAFPVQSVSRSQMGLETIQQSVAVLPHWTVVGDAQGRWSVDLRLSIVASPAVPLIAPATLVARGAPGRETAGVRQEVRHLLFDGPHAGTSPNGIIRREAVEEYDS